MFNNIDYIYMLLSPNGFYMVESRGPQKITKNENFEHTHQTHFVFFYI